VLRHQQQQHRSSVQLGDYLAKSIDPFVKRGAL
jgi:hypothetical protein